MHDADRLIADLRDHLARHDKRVAFLFGAGTSCAVRVPSSDDSAKDVPLIPDVAGLTSLCEDAVKAKGPQLRYSLGQHMGWLQRDYSKSQCRGCPLAPAYDA